MYRPMPVIREDVATLKARLTAARHYRVRQRLQLLYLIASGQVTSRSQAAGVLGLSRNTIGGWLDTYETVGLDALLAVYVPAGKRPALTAEQVRQLDERLADPTGFPSYVAIQDWIAETFAVRMSVNAIQKLVRYKLGARPKVPRPQHIKKR